MGGAASLGLGGTITREEAYALVDEWDEETHGNLFSLGDSVPFEKALRIYQSSATQVSSSHRSAFINGRGDVVATSAPQQTDSGVRAPSQAVSDE